MTEPVVDHFELALAAHKAGDFDLAERHYLPIRTMRSAAHNLAVLYKATGRYGEAEAIFRDVLASFPDDHHARHSLAHVLLVQERWAEAWPLWEARRQVGNPAIFEPQTEIPEWRGEPVAGKRVVVCAEHGLGDQILFARYLSLLRDAGAEVTVACNVAAMGRMFEAAGYATRPFTRPRRGLPAGDYWVFIGSLPLRLGAYAPLDASWLKLPLGGGGGIGVIAQGNPHYVYDAYRSMSPDGAAELLALGRSLDPKDTGAADVLATAELIAGLDAVVATDTLAPNIALMLGKPTHVLLSKVAPCWRWGVGDRSPWYPQAVIWRQARQGDWAAVIAQVKAAL